MRIALVATSVPRRCGIATFTADLKAALLAAEPSLRFVQAAIDEPNAARAYDADVRWRIRQRDPDSYRAAATSINASGADIVNLQHEFGLYGNWSEESFEDHLPPFLDELRIPLVSTLHSLPPEPNPTVREAVQTVAAKSDGVVVMAETAARLLESRYGVDREATFIPHGMPAIQPRGRRQLKRRLGIEGTAVISTFGLVDPRKGLEYMIEAMPAVAEKHPKSIYLIVGQTHPVLQRKAGEGYRNELAALVDRLGMSRHVGFVNQYLTQREIVDYLLASDVYVTPYLDPNQITSGTLAYALGAGKAIVSTRYLHAAEALDHDRGILVDFRSSEQLAAGVNAILDDPELKRRLEERAYAYGKEAAWPAVGRKTLDLMRQVVEARSRAKTLTA